MYVMSQEVVALSWWTYVRENNYREGVVPYVHFKFPTWKFKANILCICTWWAKKLLLCRDEHMWERERYEPFMLETAFLTLLSQPSQSIFTLISTVCNTRKKNNNKTIRFYMDIKSYQRNQYHTCTNTHRKI